MIKREKEDKREWKYVGKGTYERMDEKKKKENGRKKTRKDVYLEG
jgi:hypothetical protein